MNPFSKAALRAFVLGVAAFFLVQFAQHVSDAIHHRWHFPGPNLMLYVLLGALLALSIWFGRSSHRHAWFHGLLAGAGLSLPFFILALYGMSPDPRIWIWMLGRPMLWLYVLAVLQLITASLWSESAALWFGHHRLLASLVAAGSVGIVVAIFAAGLSFMHYYDARVQVRQDLRAQHLIDIPLPHLALTALNGKPIPVSALQGQITVIDFWGTWCAACIAEFPSLEAAQKEYSGNATVRFLPVNPEIEGDTPEKIERFLQRRPIAVPMALDPGPSYFDLSNKLNNNELPLMLVVDQHGDIRFCEYGFENADKTRRGIRPDINALLVRH